MTSTRRTFTIALPIHNRFPFDMLRVDQCWPKTRDDADAIENSHRAAGLLYPPGELIAVTLETDNAWAAPDVVRWNAYACHVIEGDDKVRAMLEWQEKAPWSNVAAP